MLMQCKQIAARMGRTALLKVHWKCAKCGYEWQSKVETRTRGYSNCKECKKKRGNEVE